MGGSSLVGPLTGIGHYTRHLLTELATLGVQGHVFMNGRWHTPDADGQCSDPSRADEGQATHNTGNRTTRGVAWRLARGVLRHTPLARPIAHALQSARFRQGLSGAVALYHEPNFIPLGYGRVPTVITAHDASWVRYPETHPRPRVAHMTRHFHVALARADRVIVVSDFVRRELLSLFPVEASKIRVVHNGVSPRFRPQDAATLAAYTATLALRPKSYFLALGTLEPRKRLVVALQAHQRLPAALRARYPLVIAGQKGWLVHDFEKQVAQDLSTGAVRMLGYVSDQDLPRLISGALATLYCSVYEGFGLPPLESMACGVLPLCSNRSAIPEVVGEAGVLLDPDNPEAFTDALHRAIEDAAWVEQMGLLAMARASQFSWSRCAQETLGVYQELLHA
ncbi:glycosyltransferase family 1 protein [Allopusillimonas ginsengisoli]|nr:glycosyltransferase family 1 protein [Allopusillimonas ginsengisoli]